jgi:hypothetical protein
MQLRYMRYFHLWMFFIVGCFVLNGPVFAQETGTTESLPLSEHLLVLEFSLQNASVPHMEVLNDGRGVFTITASGSVSGDLDGTATFYVNQVVSIPEVALDPLAVTFTIETADGKIEGYYVGSLYLFDGASVLTSNGSGQILSVTGVYADLFLADVFLTGQISPDNGSSETMIISPRKVYAQSS